MHYLLQFYEFLLFAVEILFFEEVRNFVKRVKGSPKAEGFSEIMLPGEKAYKNYQNSKVNGIFVNDVVWESISEKAVELDVNLPDSL
jgi:LDH2 family malate/lactate/ureidoglycolate dehydrogenase